MGAELALVLHAHLPYVRPIAQEIVEERWLYEAVAETYIPLLWALERLQLDHVPYRMTLSLSGPLLCMLADSGLMARCRQHLARVAQLATIGLDRLAGTPFEAAASFYMNRYQAIVADLDRRQNDLIAGFRAAAAAGGLELITSAGTHPYLPLLGSNRSRRAQIEAGLAEFERHFGHRPRGFWPPECAYDPGLDHLLAAAGIDWFVAESATVQGAWPPPSKLAVRTPAGVAAFGRDPQASKQVWDSNAGYPGDSAYREFYRDLIYELPDAVAAPWMVEGRIRVDSGIKLHRVTGAGDDLKEPYLPQLAAERAAEHAAHFMGLMEGRQGLVVAPFDAELFGHWWFEGPLWLEGLFRLLARHDSVRPVTLTEWLGRAPDLSVAHLPSGSWGDSGDHRTWVAPENDWVWPGLHEAERRLERAIDGGALPEAVLAQAARELMLAQASDWPFIMRNRTAVQYAEGRVCTHLQRFDSLLSGAVDPAEYKQEDGIFPALDLQAVYRPSASVAKGGRLRILMLSWEFPPNNVGGLGRHVQDLSLALTDAGHEVHVLTVADAGAPPGAEPADSVMVHRITPPPAEGNFLCWTYRLNQRMTRQAEQIAADLGRIDIVHSHDWLTGQAGMGLRARWGARLIATIHALEKGRNGFIQEPLQQAIHEEEWLLATTADRVITVSQAMAAEVYESFGIRPAVIYNGVALPAGDGLAQEVAAAVEPGAGDSPPGRGRAPRRGEPYFFYVGRLVPEKGVQVALGALAQLRLPAHLVVAGKGPMEAELRRLATEYGVAGRTHFVGRISDAQKRALLAGAVAGIVPSLYEPFGITALEAMVAKVPVIVSDTGGLAEIVTHGQDGLKAYPGDVPSWRAAMERVLENPGEAARLSRRAMGTVRERFTWDAIAAETVAVYRG